MVPVQWCSASMSTEQSLEDHTDRSANSGSMTSTQPDSIFLALCSAQRETALGHRCCKCWRRAMRWLSRSLLPTLLFCLIMSCGASGAAAETPLRVNTFPSPQNLPLYVAQSKGLFAKRGLVVQIQIGRASCRERV